MVNMPNIVLTDEQKGRLEGLAQSSSQLFMHRARLILAYGEGLPTMQAASTAGISRGRARYWKRQFISRGMEIFNAGTLEKTPLEAPPAELEMASTEPVASVTAEVTSEERVATDEELSYPEVKKSVGMKTEDNLAEAGKKVWLYHFAIMLSHEEGTLKGENSEELHDMRVATRRMRSAFEVFGEAFDPKIMNQYLKGLRRVGRALGQVRDMDVILANGLHYQEKMAESRRTSLQPLINHWTVDVADKRKKLTKLLEGEKYQHFKSEFNRFVQSPVEIKETDNPGIETTSCLRDIVPVMVYNRYARVRAYDSILPTATFTQLHALRIEFKKFRYTLEYFKEILGSSTSSLVNEIKQYQDHLGELHDADVACQLVSNFLDSWEDNQENTLISARVNPQAIVSYLAHLHAERYRLMVTFPDLWKQFSRVEFRQGMAQAIAIL